MKIAASKTLCLGSLSFFCALNSNLVNAQITPDNTLPNKSIVTKDGQIFNITGGTTAGTNLFHSFKQFSILGGDTAYFNNDASITNIISRVTGSLASFIDGGIQANGTANVFLLNPNGILFGPNATLNIGGSFIASTANSLNFADGATFSASAPQTSPILTVTAPIGLQYGRNPGSIQVKGSQLQVQSGKTLAFLGGDISIDGGVLNATGGDIALAALSGPGTINFNVADNSFELDIPTPISRANIELKNTFLSVSDISFSDLGAGRISIYSKNLNISDSQLFSNTFLGNGRGIVLDSTGFLTIEGDRSWISSFTYGPGNSGDITINANDFIVQNGALIQAETNGQGKGGDITVNAINSAIFTGDSTTSVNQLTTGTILGGGASGDITINTKSLLTKDGTIISTSSGPGGGPGGNITLNASDFVIVSGTSMKKGTPTTIGSGTFLGGDSGNIQINTKQLFVDGGAQIASSNLFGIGKVGDIIINASDLVSISGSGKSFDDNYRSNIQAFNNGEGDAGNISINTGQLKVLNSGLISAFTRDEGQGGSITINASDSVELANSSLIDASSSGSGDSGDIKINTGDLMLDADSAIETIMGDQSIGDGGNITIQADSLATTNGGSISTSTVSTQGGSAGNISLDITDNISLDGSGSGIFASTFGEAATGTGGDISIRSRNLNLLNDAVISAASYSKGDAGDINIESGSISLDNGNILGTMDSGSMGDGSTINIIADFFSAANGGLVLASTSSIQGGDAGNITFNISDGFTLSEGGAISVGTNPNSNGDSGNIFIAAKTLDILNGSSVLASTFGSGQGGGISMSGQTLTVSNGSLITSSTLGLGQGGDIKIDTSDSVKILDGSLILSSSLDNVLDDITPQKLGDAGKVEIKTGDLIIENFSGIGVSMGRPSVGDGGEISIAANSLILRNGSLITSTTFSTQNGSSGDISIDIADNISLDTNSLISAESGPGSNGNGGSVSVKGKTLDVRNQSGISASTSGEGKGGVVRINTSDSVEISNDSLILAASLGSGDAGDIDLKTGILTLDSGGGISTLMREQSIGDGGSITITADSLFATNGGVIASSTFSQEGGNAGNIRLILSERLDLAGTGTGIFANTVKDSTGNGGSILIDPPVVTITDGATISVDSQGQGDGGSITLAAGSLTLDNGTISAATTSSNGGNVTLNVEDLTLLNNNSLVSATAGEGGNGGNVSLTTQFLIGNNNSDIFARASEGQGGNINISATGIFLSPDSEISASSDFGVDGTVQLNTPGIDPSRGLETLPETVTDVSNLVAQKCSASSASNSQQSEFVVTGRGGLPSTPSDPLQSDANLAGWVTLNPETRGQSTLPSTQSSNPKQRLTPSANPERIVEAQTAHIDPQGNLILSASATQGDINLQSQGACRGV